ncbi:hypothetical protein ACFPRL_22580 [Pseudoclavibacter helvolus]
MHRTLAEKPPRLERLKSRGCTHCNRASCSGGGRHTGERTSARATTRTCPRWGRGRSRSGSRPRRSTGAARPCAHCP